jgi:DNA invertase Pin-like site-specific DNA recombinase
MTTPRLLRCAIYTRKSSEEGLDQSFNSLDAQREACEAYIKSQAHEGWRLVPKHYDDGGFSGGSMDRPGITALLDDIDREKVDTVVVYKVDRLTRSLADFAKIVEVLDRKRASFVSVTQQFNTTTSMGRLTLNVLLSFAQFEREVTGERIRDKVAASKKKGMWMGGFPPLGYDILNRKLAVNDIEAATLRSIFGRFIELSSVRALVADLKQRNIVSKRWKTRHGQMRGGQPFSRGAIYYLLRNRIYLGEIKHKGLVHRGEHPAILPRDLWDRVQTKLDANRGERSSGPRSSATHLLTGLIFDDRGNRLSPSHAKKRDGRRYRYYVSQAVLQQRGTEVGSLSRIPAQAIEDLVTDRVRRLLASSVAIDRTEERRKLVMAWVNRVEVARDTVKITLTGSGKDSVDVALTRVPVTDKVEARDSLIEVVIPIRIKCWGGEKVIEGPNGGTAYDAVQADHALIKALSQGHQWRNALATGDARSIEQLAQGSGQTEAYVRQLLALAFLAPDITEAIMLGKQPRHLTVDRLVRMKLPLSWQAQRRVLNAERCGRGCRATRQPSYSASE